MARTPKETQAYGDYRKRIRQQAKAGDPAAQALVAKWAAAVKKAKANYPAERLREYDRKSDRKERTEYRQSRALAEAGDLAAQERVAVFRAKRNKEATAKRRREGAIPKAAYILYQKESAQPAHIKAEKKNAYARTYQKSRRAMLKEAAAAGDQAAALAYQALLAAVRESGARHRANKRREKAGVPD